MASTSEVQKIDTEIGAIRQVITNLNQRIDELARKKEVLEIPAAPPAGTSLMVEVQFVHNPNMYKFLIQSVPGKGYYTTGALDKNSYFATWPALWAYFNSDDVMRRSEFRVLLESPFPGNRYGGDLDRRPEW